MSVDIIGYINILIGVVNILLGFLVLFSNAKKTVNKAYFYCTLTIGFWSLAMFFYDNRIFLDSKIWLQIVYLIAYLMTITQINFALNLYGNLNKILSKVLYTILVPLFLYGLYLLFIDDSVILKTNYDSNRNTVIADMGSSYILYFLPIIMSLVFLFYRHISRGQKEEGVKKKQSRYYWIAGFCMILPLFFLDFIMPVFFNDSGLYKYSTLGNILWTIIIGYSIFNTRFLDVRLVLGKFVEFMFKALYVFLLLSIFYFILQKSVFFNESNELVMIISLAIFSSAALWILNKKTELLIQKKFIYSQYNPIEEIQKYSSANSEALEMRQISKNTISSIISSFNPSGSSIVLFNSKSREIIFQDNIKFVSLTKEVMNSFISNWESINSNPVLIFSEIEMGFSSGKEIIDQRKQEILEFMRGNDIEIIMPLDFKSEVKGILLVGTKLDNSLYSLGDINFLEGIVKNANIAFGRASLYQELENFNQTLQQKVDNQTKELQTKVLQLQEARRKEADMIDIMGHELRTPATVVKLNIGLLQKYIDSNPTDFKKYIDRISNAVETEIGLINTLLTSAKLEGDKVEIKHEKVNIQEEIEISMHGQGKDLKEGISFTKYIQSNLPYAYADRIRVAEVLNNLVSNAIKYTEKGSITISARSQDSYIVVSVKDTGKGISQEDIPNLGEKFYRVDNYLESNIVRPGGTGLGLYITFGLVRLMGGKMDVQSKVGEGSTFTFTLPIYTDQQTDTPGIVDRFQKLGLKR